MFSLLAFLLVSTPWLVRNHHLSGETLLASVGPVSFLFGAGLFFSLLDQWKVTLPEMRLAGGGVLVLASALP